MSSFEKCPFNSSVCFLIALLASMVFELHELVCKF